MKKNYITRQEAAEIFNVHPQTIKNWIDRGLLLAGKRATTGTLVDFQSVEALQASFGNIKEAERNIKEYKAEISKLEQEYQQICRNLRDRNWIYSDIYKNSNLLVTLFGIAYQMLSVNKDERTLDIVRMFLRGHKIEEISAKHQLTPTRIRTLLSQGMKRLEFGKKYVELLEENKRLLNLSINISTENMELDRQLKIKQEKERAQKEILGIKIRKLPISTRCKNGLSVLDVYTLGDLIQHSRWEVSRIRLLGENSLKELDDLLNSYNLDWFIPSR